MGRRTLQRFNSKKKLILKLLPEITVAKNKLPKKYRAILFWRTLLQDSVFNKIKTGFPPDEVKSNIYFLSLANLSKLNFTSRILISRIKQCEMSTICHYFLLHAILRDVLTKLQNSTNSAENIYELNKVYES